MSLRQLTIEEIDDVAGAMSDEEAWAYYLDGHQDRWGDYMDTAQAFRLGLINDPHGSDSSNTYPADTGHGGFP